MNIKDRIQKHEAAGHRPQSAVATVTDDHRGRRVRGHYGQTAILARSWGEFVDIVSGLANDD